MRFADLHTHTYHSDGTRSPKEVVDVAKQHGITILCISDHDNLAAFFEIRQYAESAGVTLIPGTELSCMHRDIDVHILAYAFDANDEQIAIRLKEFRDKRQRRGAAMVEKLRTLGYEITTQRVEELAAGGAVGRPHVARALVERRYVTSVSEAFDRLIGTGKPGYVPKGRFSVEEAVALVRHAGGVTSIAHPSIYPDHVSLIPELFDLGVDAVEVMHPQVNAEDRKRYTNLARFRGKFVTGGSDDHGTAKTAQTLGTIRLPESAITPILERVERPSL